VLFLGFDVKCGRDSLCEEALGGDCAAAEVLAVLVVVDATFGVEAGVVAVE